ncbi:hypothetical protein AMTRI_Chr11g158510 [Amborella trichopoda]
MTNAISPSLSLNQTSHLSLAPSLNQSRNDCSLLPFLFSLYSSHTQSLSLSLSIFVPRYHILQQGSPTKLSSLSLSHPGSMTTEGKALSLAVIEVRITCIRLY